MRQSFKVVLFSEVRGTAGPEDALYMPLPLLAIGSMLKANGCDVVIVDGLICPDWRVRLASEIVDASYLGISALTGPSIAPALEAVAIARQHANELPIVWGGYHATHAYRALLQEGFADYVVLGPGETAAVHLAQVLGGEDKAPPRRRDLSFANIARMQAGVPTVARSPRHNLHGTSELPPPLDYGLLDVPAYFVSRPRTLHYVSSYGCPHACTFCSEPSHSWRTWRALPPTRVVGELLTLWHGYAPDRISIIDPNFSSSAQRVVAIARMLRSAGPPVVICCDMRATDVLRIARLVDLRELQAAGFAEIYIGVETGSDLQLQKLKKGATAVEIFEACRLLAAAGIKTITSFMHDLPGETLEDSSATLALCTRLACLAGNEQRHHFFTPYPGTQAADDLGLTEDVAASIPQLEWATTSTYHASRVWKGRADFRKACIDSLVKLRDGLDTPARLVLPSL